MVQVSKGPIGTKGARVTSHVSLPGRYVVFMPTVDHVGVSKRIGNDRERRRLKEVIDSVKPPEGGVVVRTLAQGLTKKKLKADIGYLVKLWEQTQTARDQVKKVPTLIHEEPDIVIQSARDLFTEDVTEIVIDDRDEYLRLKEFLGLFLPERANDVRLYEGYEPLFDEYGIEEEITRALSRKVPLPSGGHLVIDQAEALTAIDVNTGRFTGKGRDVEQTILQTNLEAVREIAYQLLFRNIGGLIVLDFIDMERHAHREKVFKALLQALKDDKAKTTAIRISELGAGRDDAKAYPSVARPNALRAMLLLRWDRAPFNRRKPFATRSSGRCAESATPFPATRSSSARTLPSATCSSEKKRRPSRRRPEGSERRIELQPRNDYHLEQFDLTGG